MLSTDHFALSLGAICLSVGLTALFLRRWRYPFIVIASALLSGLYALIAIGW